ncbi:pathogenesis-related protein 1-like [Asparagus officinalis]|uniref:pathogenesis-related protein 1-like n=1 Tax=Asparagus officinalis TaxID=4686 RepID=UPI00098E8425|nr:pathogenesis-related protein 1-like [Asparagus officinalis]
MSSGTWSREVECLVSAGRLFKAAILDWHNLGPEIAPGVIVRANLVSGDGGVGSIRELNFTSSLPYRYLKERLDFIDHDKFECTSTLVEGGPLGTKFESASTHFKFDSTSDGATSCIVKVTAIYKTLAGTPVSDDVTKSKEIVTGHLKAAEAYLLANPTAYAGNCASVRA